MATPDYYAGRAEGVALAIASILHALPLPAAHRRIHLQDMAGWLVTNGGDQFVLDLAAAISRERHPANSEAGAS